MGTNQTVSFYCALSWGSTILRKANDQLLLNLNLPDNKSKPLDFKAFYASIHLAPLYTFSTYHRIYFSEVEPSCTFGNLYVLVLSLACLQSSFSSFKKNNIRIQDFKKKCIASLTKRQIRIDDRCGNFALLSNQF